MVTTVEQGRSGDVLRGKRDEMNEIAGGRDDDLILGRNLDDLLAGGDGDDDLRGRAGDDRGVPSSVSGRRRGA